MLYQSSLGWVHANKFYDYKVSWGWNVAAAVIFGLLLLVQLIIGYMARRPALFIVWGTAAALELVGYAFRSEPVSEKFLGSLYSDRDIFITQWVCLLCGPLFLALGHADLMLRMMRKWYGAALLTYMAAATIACGVLFGLGAHHLSEVIWYHEIKSYKPGNLHALYPLVGLCLQISVTFLISLISGFFLFKTMRSDPPSNGLRKWLAATLFSQFCQLTRLIYRVVVLAADIVETEVRFMMCDWLMMSLGLAAVTLVYPGDVQNPLYPRRHNDWEGSRKGDNSSSEEAMVEVNEAGKLRDESSELFGVKFVKFRFSLQRNSP